MITLKTSLLLRAIATAGALAFGSAALVGTALAQTEKPQYGGTLNIGMVYFTLSPLSWDPADWAWKFGQDTGLVYEQLMVGDLSKSIRKGGKHAFVPIPGCRRTACGVSWPRAGRSWTTRSGSSSSCARA